MLNKTLKSKIIFFIIVVLFITGCGGGGAVAPGQLATKSIEAREIEANFDTAYRAATHAFFALGYTIKHSDKAGGIIVGTKEKTDKGSAIVMGALFGVFALMGDYTDVNTITLFLEKGKNDEKTKIRIQTMLNEDVKVDPAAVDPIWIVAQREAMLIKGISIPPDLEEKYNALQKASETPQEEEQED
jgi:hypothetical protein